jgi:hypothetical protein
VIIAEVAATRITERGRDTRADDRKRVYFRGRHGRPQAEGYF